MLSVGRFFKKGTDSLAAWKRMQFLPVVSVTYPNWIIIVFAALIVPELVGCSSLKGPLCPTLALQSYAPPVTAEHSLNSDFAQEALKRGVTVSILSPFEVELSGSHHQISWFRKNYPSLMCGFNPIGIPQREVEYTTCRAYVDSWVTIVNSKTPGDLMLDQSHYPGVCTQ